MADYHALLLSLLVNRTCLKVVFQEFSKLETSLVHFQGVLHSVGELVECEREQLLAVAIFWVQLFLFSDCCDVLIHLFKAFDVNRNVNLRHFRQSESRKHQ